MANLILILLVANAIIGGLLFNTAWKQLSPFINGDEKEDSKYPAFRRIDAKKWNKLKFFLGSITVLPIRFLIITFLVLSLFIIFK